MGLPDVTKLDWVDVRRPEEGKTPVATADLGSGERAALALAAESPGSLLIVDDGAARDHARLLGLRFTGTLGVLLRAKRSGRLEALAPILHRLDSLGFRLASTVRAATLRLAGEAG